MPSTPQLVYEFARREVLEHLTTKRVWLIGGFFAFGFLTIATLWAIFFDRLAGDLINEIETLGVDLPTKANLVLYIYYVAPIIGGFLWVQLLGLTIAYDAVVGEWVDKSIFLVLSKPVSRTALVLGKFSGGVVTVGGIFFVLLTVCYALIAFLVEEAPEVDDVGRAYLSGLIILLALTCFVSLGLFFSTVTRTTGAAMISTLGTWLIGLPILGRLGFFWEVATDETPNFNADHVEFFYYLDPSGDMRVATRVLFSEVYEPLRQIEDFFGISAVPDSTGWAIFAMSLFTALFLGLAVWRVKTRNFE